MEGLEDMTETSNFLRRRMMSEKVWKPSKRYPEFEVSNYGEVRKRGERATLKPVFDDNNNQYRVHLVTVNGKAQVNLGNLVAECFIGERPANKKVVFLNNKPEDISSYTAANVDYQSFKYPPRHTKKQPITPVDMDIDILPSTGDVLNVTVNAAAVQPQFVVLGVGAMILTADEGMAVAQAALSGMDAYRLIRKGKGIMTVWVLGEKVN
jgi:hypothetical protein